MLLGQLFYYLKTIDEVKFPIDASNLSDIELAGLGKLDFEDFKDLSEIELKRKIRDIFSSNYSNYLKLNKLDFANNFWLALTSPKKNNNLRMNANTDFQKRLLEWQKNDFSILDLKDVLEEGRLALSEEDVAVFYGLTVIYKFTNLDNFKKNEIGLIPEIDQKNKDLKEEPQILVLTKPNKFPLFMNLNSICLSVNEETEEKEILDKVQYEIQEYASISLVLVDFKDSQRVVSFLQRHLPTAILVSSLDLESMQTSGNKNQTFFDKIVKQTLGIRLT